MHPVLLACKTCCRAIDVHQTPGQSALPSANKSMLAKDKEDSLITGSCSKSVQSKGPQFLEYQSSSMSHSANPSNMFLLLPKRLKFSLHPVCTLHYLTLNHPALELWSKNSNNNNMWPGDGGKKKKLNSRLGGFLAKTIQFCKLGFSISRSN